MSYRPDPYYARYDLKSAFDHVKVAEQLVKENYPKNSWITRNLLKLAMWLINRKLRKM